MGRVLGLAIVVLLAGFSLRAFQAQFREYPGWEYYEFPKPADWAEPAEWTFARLMYPSARIQIDWQHRPYYNWWEGRTNWTIDYPRSDRHLAAAIRRLTRISAKSVEQPIDPRTDEMFDFPWLYAVEVGHWELTDDQAAKLREFLLRGGFFMCDDFHGTDEWEVFMRTMSRVFPDRPVVDIDDNDPIFKSVFDLQDRYQVPGAQFLSTGSVSEKDGYVAHWRGIYDDRGRLMVAICHNMDLGDSWEHADNPAYPEKFSALGIRIGVNYIVYSMTH
jgi:hypothetical protein